VFVLFCDFFFVEMVDKKEQRVCIKFCFKLGKSVAGTHQMIKKHLAMTLWVRCKPTTGLTGLKMAEHQLTMTNVLDDLQLAQHQKMLQKCVR
jgi:hypothetical protein